MSTFVHFPRPRHRPGRRSRPGGSLAAVSVATLMALMAAIKAACARRARRRTLVLDARCIAALDDAICRDLGLVRAEAASFAAERHGLVEATRVRVVLTLATVGPA